LLYIKTSFFYWSLYETGNLSLHLSVKRRIILEYYKSEMCKWCIVLLHEAELLLTNSGIFTCENISFFPPELLLHSYKCSGYVPCCVTVKTHTIVSWTKSVKCHWRLWHTTNMTSLTSYEDFQFETKSLYVIWIVCVFTVTQQGT
jgi:hypothetical protein